MKIDEPTLTDRERQELIGLLEGRFGARLVLGDELIERIRAAGPRAKVIEVPHDRGMIVRCPGHLDSPTAFCFDLPFRLTLPDHMVELLPTTHEVYDAAGECSHAFWLRRRV